MTSQTPWRVEARALILLALPMIAGNIAWSAIAASDLLLLGRRGAESVAAGALAFEDALVLTRRRGELMYEAGLARPGAMAAVLGLSPADVEAACAEALKSADIQKRWVEDLGLDVPPAGRAGFQAFIEEDRKLWKPAVDAAGVKLD